MLFGNTAHFRLFQLAHREQRFSKGTLFHGMQKVALVFVVIQSF